MRIERGGGFGNRQSGPHRAGEVSVSGLPLRRLRVAEEARPELGTRPSKRLRSQGRIPAVIYGHGDDPVSVSVDARDLRSAFAGEAGENALFDLDVSGTRHLAIARALQRHPVRQSISHVDFQIVSRDELVPADVPITLVGEALAVTRLGGNVEHALLSLHIHAKPGDIPPVIEVDISELSLGDSIRLSDVLLPPGVSTDVDPESTVAVAQAPRALEVAAEGAEGADEPAAESAETATDEH